MFTSRSSNCICFLGWRRGDRLKGVNGEGVEKFMGNDERTFVLA